MLKAFEVLRAVAILDFFEALDVVSQAGVYLLLLGELELELLDAIFHLAIWDVVCGDAVFMLTVADYLCELGDF